MKQAGKADLVEEDRSLTKLKELKPPLDEGSKSLCHLLENRLQENLSWQTVEELGLESSLSTGASHSSLEVLLRLKCSKLEVET